MIDDKQRKLLQRAREIEQERVEIMAWAVEQRVVDLLPEPWAAMLEFDDPNKPMVEVTYHTALYPQDIVVMTEREVRDQMMFIAHLADEVRARRNFSDNDGE